MSESATTPSKKSRLNNHVTKKLHGNGDPSTLRENRYQYQPPKGRIRPLDANEIATISKFRGKEQEEAPVEAPKKTRKRKPRAKVATA